MSVFFDLLPENNMVKTIFKTDRRENSKTRKFRLGMNVFPAFRRTGGRVCFISDDWKEMHIRLGLNWKTKNYVGTVFGGSIYGALDPVYMLQLMKILGNDYVIWDKAASIKFIKPIRKNVFAKFLITEEVLNEIISKVRSENKLSVDLSVTFQDEEGLIYAEVVKTIYIADKKYYKSKRSKQE